MSNAGYERVNLANSITKKQKRFSIHRLVAYYFVNGDKNLIVNHIDGNKRNNSYKNLEWVSYSENNSHAYRTGLRSEEGTKNPSNIYNENTIIEICKLLEKGYGITYISEKIFEDHLPKHKALIAHIKNKTRWTCISKNFKF